MSEKNVLKVEGLAKNFRTGFWGKREQAVKGISFEVEAGQIYGLVGPNGAGKTTTIKSILGLIRADQGTISLFGQDHLSPAVRARLGYLPENPYFYDYLTAAEILDFYGRLFGLAPAERRKRIDRLLPQVGLVQARNKALRKFSRGMLQRIGMAQALLNDPEFLILDEPLSGLDPVGRKELKDILMGLRQEGKTIFFSSHIMPDVETLCDRVALLVKGELVKVGTLSQLLAPKVKAVELVVSGLEPGDLAELRQRADTALDRGNSVLFNFRDEAAADEAIRLVSRTAARIVSVSRQKETLEEYFMQEIGRGNE